MTFHHFINFKILPLFFYNKSTKAGGVAIYLRKKYAGIILENYSFQLPHVESLLITVTKPYKFIVGIVYKPPNASTDDFLQFINDTAEYLITQNVPCYLLGDFNINLLKDEKKANDLINLLYSHNFFPTITKPTRVTKHSASLIDHIWSNNLQNLEASGILYTSLSDHFPIFNVFSNKLKNSQPSSTVSFVKRIFNPASFESFRLALASYNWIPDMIDNDVNESYKNYMQNFKSLYDQHFHFKRYNCKENIQVNHT